jgi:hypothetical protein
MLRGQAFSSAELLYRVNKLPLALVVKLLELTGVERSLGAAATVSLRFVLTAPRPIPFTVPKGFIVGSSSGNKLFTTDELLIIPAGELGGDVTATATAIGTGYNLPAYQINQATQPLAFPGPGYQCRACPRWTGGGELAGRSGAGAGKAAGAVPGLGYSVSPQG